MKKTFLAGMLAAVMIAAVLAAGCTSPFSPTSTGNTTGATDQDIGQYLGTSMQQLGFTVATPFSLQPSPQTGIALYSGTVSDPSGTYAASVHSCADAATSQAQFAAQRDAFIAQGYATVQQSATSWIGFDANARRGAACEYGTSQLMPYYCMALVGNAAGPASYTSTMWQQTWSRMHGSGGNGYGMGPNMGQGMNPDVRSRMQTTMQSHQKEPAKPQGPENQPAKPQGPGNQKPPENQKGPENPQGPGNQKPTENPGPSK